MNARHFNLLLIAMTYMTHPFVTAADDVTIDSESFSGRVIALQDETRYLCSHIEEKSLVAIKRFKTLMRDAHIHCPDNKAMETTLVNVEAMAKKYYSFIAEQQTDCWELFNMLTKGLENGGLVVYNLKEGNYSLVTSIIDKWHESFTKFRATFYLTDTPLEIMLENKKVFYHDSWTEGIVQFIRTLTSPLILSLILLVTTLVFTRFYTIVTIILWFIILCTLFAATVKWYPAKISFPKSVRYNWYPDATSTLEVMIVDRDNLQSNLSRQILSIEELQHHSNMYHNKTVQVDVDEFVHTLVGGVRQATKELSDAYLLSEKMPSLFRRTHERIESQAKKTGRLSEANDLLIALNKTSDRYEVLQRTLQASVIHQQKILPILKEQTQSMQVLVQEDRLVEIGRIINHHQDALMDIDGSTYKVQIEVEQIIEIVNNKHTDGVKKAIESLKDESVADQIKAIVYGVAGTTTSTVLGALAIKTGYAMVTVTATAVAGPILAVAGGMGMLGVGAYCAVTNFNDYMGAARYKNELAALETERVNLKIAMEQLAKAVADQQKALKSCQASLSKIAVHSGQFSRIPGFTLNRIQRSAINDELLNVITQYNRMMAIYALFTTNMVKNRQALPEA